MHYKSTRTSNSCLPSFPAIPAAVPLQAPEEGVFIDIDTAEVRPLLNLRESGPHSPSRLASWAADCSSPSRSSAILHCNERDLWMRCWYVL